METVAAMRLQSFFRKSRRQRNFATYLHAIDVEDWKVATCLVSELLGLDMQSMNIREIQAWTVKKVESMKAGEPLDWNLALMIDVLMDGELDRGFWLHSYNFPTTEIVDADSKGVILRTPIKNVGLFTFGF